MRSIRALHTSWERLERPKALPHGLAQRLVQALDDFRYTCQLRDASQGEEPVEAIRLERLVQELLLVSGYVESTNQLRHTNPINHETFQHSAFCQSLSRCIEAECSRNPGHDLQDCGQHGFC